MRALIAATTGEYLVRGLIACALIGCRLMLGGLLPRYGRRRE